MRGALFLVLCCVFALGLGACDSSSPKPVSVPKPAGAGGSSAAGATSSNDAAGKSGAADAGASKAGTGGKASPGKSNPGKSNPDKSPGGAVTDSDAGSPEIICAGFAGLKCPGLGRCGDDPSDDCDPEKGGADCAGICICDVKAKCHEGQTWNADPDACRCEDAAPAEGDAGTEDVAEEAVRCGGFAAIACPGASTCEDDPDDDCDPTNGGADCGGVCHCNVSGVCIAPAEWNPAPGVCACES